MLSRQLKYGGNFIDRVVVKIRAGKGGDGCIHFAREKFRPKGPPSGGHGGRGASVIFLADPRTGSLNLAEHIIAQAGGCGEKMRKAGKNAVDLVVRVPVGTVITEAEHLNSNFERTDLDFDYHSDSTPQGRWKVSYAIKEKMPLKFLHSISKELSHREKDEAPYNFTKRIKDTRQVVSHITTPAGKRQFELDDPGDVALVCAGGRGGYGNPHFRSYFRPHDMPPCSVATRGKPGESVQYIVELKLLADIGLVGMPNAGKSTILRALTNATPKVADYAFTTLRPYLGRLRWPHDMLDSTAEEQPEESAAESVPAKADLPVIHIVDIPGLIEDASENRGLGHSFLRHIERAKGFLYMIDISEPEPWETLRILRHELESYQPELSRRPSIIVANKIDKVDPTVVAEKINGLESFLSDDSADVPSNYAKPVVIGVSALHGNKLRQLVNEMAGLVEAERAAEAEWKRQLQAQEMAMSQPAETSEAV